MTAIGNGRGGVGEFGESWRQIVAIPYGLHEIDQGISLLRMIGQQPGSIEDLYLGRLQLS